MKTLSTALLTAFVLLSVTRPASALASEDAVPLRIEGVDITFGDRPHLLGVNGTVYACAISRTAYHGMWMLEGATGKPVTYPDGTAFEVEPARSPLIIDGQVICRGIHQGTDRKSTGLFRVHDGVAHKLTDPEEQPVRCDHLGVFDELIGGIASRRCYLSVDRKPYRLAGDTLTPVKAPNFNGFRDMRLLGDQILTHAAWEATDSKKFMLLGAGEPQDLLDEDGQPLGTGWEVSSYRTAADVLGVSYEKNRGGNPPEGMQLYRLDGNVAKPLKLDSGFIPEMLVPLGETAFVTGTKKEKRKSYTIIDGKTKSVSDSSRADKWMIGGGMQAGELCLGIVFESEKVHGVRIAADGIKGIKLKKGRRVGHYPAPAFEGRTVVNILEGNVQYVALLGTQGKVRYFEKDGEEMTALSAAASSTTGGYAIGNGAIWYLPWDSE